MNGTIQNKIALLILVFYFAVAGIDQSKSADPTATLETATLGGGCFWCMEHAFDEVAGIVSTTSGYMGGQVENPSYEAVSSGKTGHAEVVQVVYDRSQISYAEILDVYWRNIDPTVRDRQFCDWGSQYRSAIFYHDGAQKELAMASKIKLDQTKPFSDPILTEISRAGAFYPAEEYHQDFHHKNPVRYKFYRFSCGRDQRLKALWG